MTWLRSTTKILRLRCDEASELASRNLDEPLGFVDRIALHGHLLACRSCRLYRRQIQSIRAMMANKRTARHPGLSDSARERINQAMKEESSSLWNG